MSDSEDSESFHSADEGETNEESPPKRPSSFTSPPIPQKELSSSQEKSHSHPAKPAKELQLDLKSESKKKLAHATAAKEVPKAKEVPRPEKNVAKEPSFDPMEGDLDGKLDERIATDPDFMTARGGPGEAKARSIVHDEESQEKTVPEGRESCEEKKEDSNDHDGGWDDWDINEEDLKTPDTGIPPAFPSRARPFGNPSPPPSADRPATLWGGLNSMFGDGISSLTEGISTVLESVETTLGAPTPEELVRMSLEERLALKEAADDVKESWPEDEHDDCDSADEVLSDGGSEAGECSSSSYQSDACRHTSPTPQPSSPFGGLFSGVSNVFGSTGKTLVAGSLDVLESIGKKTFDALTETDEKTQRRKFILSAEKPNLSQVLRERQAAGPDPDVTVPNQSPPSNSFPSLFEKHQGMISLEALEMLSENCTSQLKDLSCALINESLLQEIREAFDADLDGLSVSEDEAEKLEEEVKEELEKLSLPFRAERLLEVQRKQREWLEACEIAQFNGERKEAQELFEVSLDCLAELTARGIETFLKLGQLLLAAPPYPLDVSPLLRIAQILTAEISVLSSKFSSCLNTAADDSEDPDSVNGLITELFLEASNSSSYLSQAFRLLSPVAELTAVNQGAQ